MVAAAGAIQTPPLLRRSGLANKNIGMHLRLHPGTAVLAVFDQEIRPWEGGMQTRFSREHNDLDGRGYGVLYETAAVNPGVVVPFVAWRSAGQHRARMAQLAHLGGVGVILRDQGCGRVQVKRDGEPVVRYKLAGRDLDH
ncbi:MAG TPA: GMC family oxidoreductase N-terminal domain-containing protein, partial [Mycobacterium sp.]